MSTVERTPKSVSVRRAASSHDVVISRKQADRIMSREARELGYTSVAKAVRDARTGKLQGKLPATKLLILDTLVHNHTTK